MQIAPILLLYMYSIVVIDNTGEIPARIFTANWD